MPEIGVILSFSMCASVSTFYKGLGPVLKSTSNLGFHSSRNVGDLLTTNFLGSGTWATQSGPTVIERAGE